MARRLVLRLDYCIGCRSCEAACRSRFKSEARVRYAEVTAQAYFPLSCRHCAEPLCAAACPFEVIRKDPETGVVSRSSFHCVGCRSCMLACPFGVMDTYLLRSTSQKCSLCQPALPRGKPAAKRPEGEGTDTSPSGGFPAQGAGEGGPRCATTCPTGALQYVEESELAEKKTGVGIAARSPHWRRP